MSQYEKDPPPYYPVVPYQPDLEQINEVIPGKLYISGYQGSENQEKLLKWQITHIINLIDDQKKFKQINYMNITNIQDDPEDQHRLRKQFQPAFNFIENALKDKNNRVLIHCAAGISRSSTLVIAYLINSTKKPLIETFKLVREKRKIIWPNEGFMTQLIDFEKQVTGKSTIQIEEYKIWQQFNHEHYENRMKARQD